jgi:Rox3 mediator complex subunit
MPDEDWHNTNVHGKEIPERMPNLDRVRKACQIVQGPLPGGEAEKWKALLATDEPVAPAKAAVGKGSLAGTQQRPSNATTPLQSIGGATQQGHNGAPVRPARSTAKRSYQDASFAGYGEGFVDDEDISDDDGRMGGPGARKRRKKDSEFAVSPLPPQQQAQYGVGVVAGGPRH